MEPNPDLGIDVDFDNEGFRDAIHFAMQMGFNPDPDKRAVFIKKATTKQYFKNSVLLDPADVRTDRDGKPLDPEVELIRGADEEIRSGTGADEVNVAIEVDRADAEELPVGNFRPTKVVITALDVDYVKIKDCRELVYNGDRYLFGYEPESNGLFSVGVYTMIFYGKDES
jgi:hypothetical protein